MMSEIVELAMVLLPFRALPYELDPYSMINARRYWRSQQLTFAHVVAYYAYLETIYTEWREHYLVVITRLIVGESREITQKSFKFITNGGTDEKLVSSGMWAIGLVQFIYSLREPILNKMGMPQPLNSPYESLYLSHIPVAQG